MIDKNPDKEWNWNGISSNLFTKEKELFELRVKKQKFVQDHLFKSLTERAFHPNKIQKYLDMGYSIEELDDIR